MVVLPLPVKVHTKLERRNVSECAPVHASGEGEGGLWRATHIQECFLQVAPSRATKVTAFGVLAKKFVPNVVQIIDNLLTKAYNVVVEYLFAKWTDFANAERKLQNSRETSVRDVAQLFAKEVFCDIDIPPRRTWAKGGIAMKLTLILCPSSP